MALPAAVAREGAAFEAKDADDDIAAAFAASGRSANNLTICCPLLCPSSLPLSARTQSALTRAGNAWLPNTYYMADRRRSSQSAHCRRERKRYTGREGGSHRKILCMYV